MINGYITDGIENTKVTFYKDQGVQVFNGFPAEKMNTLLEYEDSEQASQIVIINGLYIASSKI